MKPSQLIIRNLAIALTEEQTRLLSLLDDFILDRRSEKISFLLKGYAGTGKTMLVSQLVDVLKIFGYKVALLAPTGRAAKVLSGYANKPAYTIHRRIYRQTEIGEGGLIFQRMGNTTSDTVFIVDEASMISDKSDYGQKSLLADLINYVFDARTNNNKLLLIGDSAQLPPVGDGSSPA